MKRRDALRELLTSPGSASEVPATPAPATKRHEPIKSGALRTMGLTLKQMSAEADDARVLRAQIESGERVVELDPSLVDPSFIVDRIPVERDPGFDAFVESMRSGQQVPILVRPHPDQPGRYQAAYGHRRLKAAVALGRPVRSIVRQLTDAELVIAQGKENLERRDLSFVERAMFAAHLEERGFERTIIMSALGVDKADLSRLVALARAIPTTIIHAIGPAPKTGRPRWTQLADAFGRPDAHEFAAQAIGSDAFRGADSDRRFGIVLEALRPPIARESRAYWRDEQDQAVVRVERSAANTRLTVDERLAPGFAAFLIERLGALHEEFTQRLVSAEALRTSPGRPTCSPVTGDNQRGAAVTANDG
jgi:ParB family transcriptional regulator, chromosome partitioning protein